MAKFPRVNRPYKERAPSSKLQKAQQKYFMNSGNVARLEVNLRSLMCAYPLARDRHRQAFNLVSMLKAHIKHEWLAAKAVDEAHKLVTKDILEGSKDK